MKKVTVVVSFSSLEKRFFNPLITELKKFSDDIIVNCFDHFFDGTPEDVCFLQNLKDKNTDISFNILQWNDQRNSKFWHNEARWVGVEKRKNDLVLFLDADEIPDGELMKKFIESEDTSCYDMYVFKCNWYFKDPRNVATTTEFCGLLANVDRLKKDMFFTQHERWFFNSYRLKTAFDCTYLTQTILHHFSWVRTKDEMLKKVSSWAHKHDRDWTSLVEKEFENPIGSRDFVHGYSYRTCENIFNIEV